jgi:hypothetical protein
LDLQITRVSEFPSLSLWSVLLPNLHIGSFCIFTSSNIKNLVVLNIFERSIFWVELEELEPAWVSVVDLHIAWSSRILNVPWIAWSSYRLDGSGLKVEFPFLWWQSISCLDDHVSSNDI